MDGSLHYFDDTRSRSFGVHPDIIFPHSLERIQQGFAQNENNNRSTQILNRQKCGALTAILLRLN